MTTRQLDESEYAYPVLEVKHIIDWKSVVARDQETRAHTMVPIIHPMAMDWVGILPI